MTTIPDEVEPLRGQVAAIVSNRAIAINRGRADGVKVGTRFAVLYSESSGLQITDPETGKSLGQVDMPKVVVKVFRVVGEHLSVARTYRRIPGTTTRPTAFAAILVASDPLGLKGTVVPDRYETLAIDDADRIDRKLDPDDSYIEVGDPVTEVLGDEYDGFSDYR